MHTEIFIDRFQAAGDNAQAAKMSRYMKDKFLFYGVDSKLRKELTKSIYQDEGFPDNFLEIAKELFSQPYRELHYVAQEMLLKGKRQWTETILGDFKWFVATHSWWDTVDFIASNLVGGYFQKWPNLQDEVMLEWSNSKNLWLVRTSIIHQLKYKDSVNVDLLKTIIEKHKDDKEFFIKKAIGWSLRQYAKYDLPWVKKVLQEVSFQPFSVKEASKHF